MKIHICPPRLQHRAFEIESSESSRPHCAGELPPVVAAAGWLRGQRRGWLFLLPLLLALLPVAVAASPKPSTAAKLCPVVVVTNTIVVTKTAFVSACPVPFCDYQLEAGRRYVLRVRVMNNAVDAPWQRWKGYPVTCSEAGVYRLALPVAAVLRAEYRLEEACRPARVIPCLPSPVAQPTRTLVLYGGRLRAAQ